MGTIDWEKKNYGSQWGPSSVWIPISLKTMGVNDERISIIG